MHDEDVSCSSCDDSGVAGRGPSLTALPVYIEAYDGRPETLGLATAMASLTGKMLAD